VTAAGSVPRPTNLHIGHGWGGGLSKWIDDFANHDRFARNLVLQSGGTSAAYGLDLTLMDGPADVLGRWVLDRPIAVSAIEHAEYRRLLADLLDTYKVDHMYVSSLIGHSLDAIDTGVPTTVVFHDYFPFCIALNPFFGGVCRSCEPDRLIACHQDNPLALMSRGNSAGYWLELRARYVELIRGPGLMYVAPSANVVSHLADLHPVFGELDISVVPHGLGAGGRDCFGGASDDRPLRLLMLGRMKGLDRLERVFGRLQVLGHVTIVGAGDEGRAFATRAGVTVIDRYDLSELTPILYRTRADLGLFLGNAPETFSYTLSEAWAHGIPVAAQRHGSFGERIRHGETGWLFDHDDDLIQLLVELDADRERLRAVHERVVTMPVRSAQEMVDDYHRLRGAASDLSVRPLERL
jgi:glycosyltransferase involved in cell wall biosynthesis